MTEKRLKQKQGLLLSIFILSCTACVNKINDEIRQSNIPILFSTQINKEATTKVTENTFDVGDRFGLFATLAPSIISEERYIDNMLLTCGDNSMLIPQREVFYPEGDAKLDFISYYPYQSDGISSGSTLLNITVQNDQSKLQNYSLSNFMTARVPNVSNDEETVHLKYNHQLAKIKIVLAPKEGENIDDMLAANPRIIATGFKTQAIYNLQTDELSSLLNESETDIIPFGKWEKNADGTLSGKELIVIPQTHANNKQAFTLEWNGNIYTCSISSMPIQKDTELEIRIDALQSTSKALNGAVASIKEWGFNKTESSENEYDITAIHTTSLSFKTSDVYRVYHQGKPVAEVCREYLRSADNSINSKAITAYPVLSNEQTDFANGVVLRLPDKTAMNHGGKISWNAQSNSLSYTPGSSKPIEKFYIDENKKITLEPSATVLSVNVSNYLIRDIRNGNLKTYPIVKIGTQYWMKEDLQPTLYNDNTVIPLKKVLEPNDGYFEWTEQNLRLYNGEAVLTGKLAPYGWKIPSENDWSSLKSYLNENAAAVKKPNVWKPYNDTTNYPTTNETGLNIFPNGFYIESEGISSLINPSISVAYWVYDGTSNELSKVVMLTNKNNDISFKTEVKSEGKEYYNAFSIRCIKE